MKKEFSFFYGLVLTDGTITTSTRNRGKIQIELSIRDRNILDKLHIIFPESKISIRQRSTNFSQNHESCIFSLFYKKYRDYFFKQGYPKCQKAINARPPNCEYSKCDFWRGVIDGDGSIGQIKNGDPYISLITKSEDLANSYLRLLEEEFGIIKICNKNKRDDCYNITVKNEDAITLGNFLYGDSHLYLDRKYQKYQQNLSWKRTKNKITRKYWSKEDDNFILSNSIDNSMMKLNRSRSSIACRKNRLIKFNK